ncbi:hypothetical protein PCE1_003252 [Barthelona sp. PCE]
MEQQQSVSSLGLEFDIEKLDITTENVELDLSNIQREFEDFCERFPDLETAESLGDFANTYKNVEKDIFLAEQELIDVFSNDLPLSLKYHDELKTVQEKITNTQSLITTFKTNLTEVSKSIKLWQEQTSEISHRLENRQNVVSKLGVYVDRFLLTPSTIRTLETGEIESATFMEAFHHFQTSLKIRNDNQGKEYKIIDEFSLELSRLINLLSGRIAEFFLKKVFIFSNIKQNFVPNPFNIILMNFLINYNQKLRNELFTIYLNRINQFIQENLALLSKSMMKFLGDVVVLHINNTKETSGLFKKKFERVQLPKGYFLISESEIALLEYSLVNSRNVLPPKYNYEYIRKFFRIEEEYLSPFQVMVYFMVICNLMYINITNFGKSVFVVDDGMVDFSDVLHSSIDVFLTEVLSKTTKLTDFGLIAVTFTRFAQHCSFITTFDSMEVWPKFNTLLLDELRLLKLNFETYEADLKNINHLHRTCLLLYEILSESDDMPNAYFLVNAIHSIIDKGLELIELKQNTSPFSIERDLLMLCEGVELQKHKGDIHSHDMLLEELDVVRHNGLELLFEKYFISIDKKMKLCVVDDLQRLLDFFNNNNLEEQLTLLIEQLSIKIDDDFDRLKVYLKQFSNQLVGFLKDLITQSKEKELNCSLIEELVENHSVAKCIGSKLSEMMVNNK